MSCPNCGKAWTNMNSHYTSSSHNERQRRCSCGYSETVYYTNGRWLSKEEHDAEIYLDYIVEQVIRESETEGC